MRSIWLSVIGILLTVMADAAFEAPAGDKLPVAAILGSYHARSHADILLGRIFNTYTMDGSGAESRLRIISMYIDKPRKTDYSRALAWAKGFTLYPNVEQALTLGTGTLAVKAVFLCTEHGDYPRSPRGEQLHPHRELFDEVVRVFKASGNVAPIFIDKHVAMTIDDSLHIYNTANAMGIPLMAGSSVPGAWREPAADVNSTKPLKEIVGLSYHTLDAYGFHGLEMIQSLAEQRNGGETGIVSVQYLEGPAVWEAAGTLYDQELFLDTLAYHKPVLTLDTVKKKVKLPTLVVVNYRDGLRASMLTLNGAVREWTAAWRYGDGEKTASLFRLNEEKAYLHFALQMQGIESMYLTGKPAWPVERTVLTSGILDAAFTSKVEHNRVVETPGLRDFGYRAFWRWSPPPPVEEVGKK